MKLVSITTATVAVLAVAVMAEPPVGLESQVAPRYGPPGGSYRPRQRPSNFNGYPAAGDDQYEPANYEFKYDVLEAEYGVRFGHQEARQGDVTQGQYYVLLPDGRTQHVQYTADQGGYHPRVTYEEAPSGFGRGGGYAK